MKIAYCGYDFFYGVGEKLQEQGHEIIHVFSFTTDNKYDYSNRVLSLSQKTDCPIKLSKITDEDISWLSKHGCDAIICAAYPFKVPASWADKIQYGLNFHPSPLPVGKGIWPLPWVILKNLKESAVTLHKLSNKWDSGDILAASRYTVDSTDNLESISAKSELAAIKLTEDIIPNIQKYWNASTPQSEGEYWSAPSKEDRTLNWNESCEYNNRIVRAFGKFESYAYINDVRYYVRDISTWKSDHGMKPGTLVKGHGREYIITCKDGFICLRHFEVAPIT